MPHPTETSMLKVPGARLYYEVHGQGPLLLMIAGGPTDAGVFTGLAQHLANRYTVVTYDPRGNSRSPLDDAPADLDVDVHADDAARLIAALGDGAPADIFGTSGGAQIGLNLAVRHPRHVRALVAHEPPCVLMLDDPSAVIAKDRAIQDTYRRDGLEAAVKEFMEMAGLDDAGGPADAPPHLPPEVLETFTRINANMEYFIAHGLTPLSLYRPEINRLRGAETPVLVGIGEASNEDAAGPGRALAARLGIEPVAFPGDHGGYGPHAGAFAEILHAAFGRNQTRRQSHLN
ncbi:alpha/beta fold hydrolase [Nitratireductor sp. CAU 1489]|uniref:Alpha/beta fold hydrolase n=1 Tax=Nitratireductor arenosus TaxID=2682096 RepID=A0A844QJV4_9HYPH|nr:alpha/beta hydrolase [Nitratireductor arenosus]MVA98201.1 alpha/beta fold hydrolase [Nitratireductor arenosus]